MTKTRIADDVQATQAFANIYTALAVAQQNMGPVFKGATNPHFKSRYADLADVMQVVLPALNVCGVAAWSSIVTIDGERYMRTTLSHGESDTHICCDVPLIVQKNDMQGMKSATTYAKRVGIESLAGVAPEADDDGNAAVAAAPKGPSAKGIKAAAAEAMSEGINAAKTAIDKSTTLDALKSAFTALPKDIRSQLSVITAKDLKKAELEIVPNADLLGSSKDAELDAKINAALTMGGVSNDDLLGDGIPTFEGAK